MKKTKERPSSIQQKKKKRKKCMDLQRFNFNCQLEIGT